MDMHTWKHIMDWKDDSGSSETITHIFHILFELPKP